MYGPIPHLREANADKERPAFEAVSHWRCVCESKRERELEIDWMSHWNSPSQSGLTGCDIYDRDRWSVHKLVETALNTYYNKYCWSIISNSCASPLSLLGWLFQGVHKFEHFRVFLQCGLYWVLPVFGVQTNVTHLLKQKPLFGIERTARYCKWMQ